jgi:hypothetical protein
MPLGIRRFRRGGGQARAEGPASLAGLIDSLPAALKRQAVTHSSWVDHRSESYGRLAFLGDGVLGVAVAEHLFRRFPRADIGRLTKVHGQAVSGRACVEVAYELGLPRMLREAAPAGLEGGIDPESLLASERALASVSPCRATIRSSTRETLSGSRIDSARWTAARRLSTCRPTSFGSWGTGSSTTSPTSSSRSRCGR